MRGNYVIVMVFYFQYFQISMLINLECTLAKTRMGFGRIKLPSKRPMRGQYVFIIAKSQSFYML